MTIEQRKPAVSQFGSVDPAPPDSSGDVSTWAATLCNESLPMFQRMRSVFSLRNHGSNEACRALCTGFSATSALLRHELAYVLGQMQNDTALPSLIERLSDAGEHIMVRHEAAEALGAIGNLSAKPVLEEFLHDENPEVAESCEVAIDLLNWCATSEWEQLES
ncbi:MAG: HEAT repeat domain-containing protein [Candidatus Poseidoniaceae archaeon]|nr:HEAT repeat domain-containing protein [Candidatus Poseidoniaceae archaeon]